MSSQTLSDIYNYAAFSYEYYNAATQNGQQHMTELQPDAGYYGNVPAAHAFTIVVASVVCVCRRAETLKKPSRVIWFGWLGCSRSAR